MLITSRFQGASATFPSFYCDVKLSSLKSQSATEQHNFQTNPCKARTFPEMRIQLENQIKCLGEPFDSIEDFKEEVFKNGRHDLERMLRARGKKFQSVIGDVNSPVESFDYVLGGPLHNEIGISNDVLDHLIKELRDGGFDDVVRDINKFLTTPKVAGGAGCTPAQHHGGKYNGKDAVKILDHHSDLFRLVPETFSRKEDHSLLFSTLDKIFKKTRLARFLSESERITLETNVMNLSAIIALRFKNMSITLKMHDVLVHTVRFVRKYHSVGFFGEQGLESLHQIMHRDEIKYNHLNNQPVTKIKLCMDQQNIRSLLD